MAQRVRELRGRLGLAQEKMAARLGVMIPAINRWENGGAKLSPLALKQIQELPAPLGDSGRDLRPEYFPEERI
jgi:transcriptional regulator with XRE-family HTH domain